jgi:FtsH-binding integral membrane protein
MKLERRAYLRGVYSAVGYTLLVGGILTTGYIYLLQELGYHYWELAVGSGAIFVIGWWLKVHNDS